MRFEELGVRPELAALLEKHGITEPTTVQKSVVPHILKGNDVLAQSQTGSGKTIGFAVPIIQKITKTESLVCIVLCPTRELALQITAEFEKFGGNLKTTTIYGGASINVQIQNLPGTNIVVGTPGRVLDLMERRALSLSKIKYVVLDEADRMLDMGFIDDIRKILSQTPEQRETCLFSATIAPEIKKLSDRFLKNPFRIDIKPEKQHLLKQFYYGTQDDLKFSLLVHLLKQEGHNLVLIFTKTRGTCNNIARNLNKHGFKAEALNGSMSQAKREKVVEEFKSGIVQVLVATDVAARGLHIEGITHVYNYDIPEEVDTYVHRVGRTARVDAEGFAISLVTGKDYIPFNNILDSFRDKLTRLQTPEFERVSIQFTRDHDGFRGRRPGFSRGPKRQGGFSRGGPRQGGRFSSRSSSKGDSGQRSEGSGQGQRSGPRRSFGNRSPRQ